jgi:hypothetical protein
MKQLDHKIFPSEERTIYVESDEVYGGAHRYGIQNSVGYEDNRASYDPSFQYIHFVEKSDTGHVSPGLQSEQLALVLLDRTQKLNARFPSPFNVRMIEGLEIYLNACKDRVLDRIERGVMGKLKK